MINRQVPGTNNSPRGGDRRGLAAGNPPPVPSDDPTEGLTPNQKRFYEAWIDFGGRLMQVLGVLEEDEYLIISLKGSNRFVQFAGQGAHGMRVETVSNFYLPEAQQLGEAQHDAMLKLGWNAPCNLPDEFGHEPVGSPNYFLDLAQPVDVRQVAALAVSTLLGPLDADHPLDLEYRSFAESGEAIRWPTLKLRRAPN
jgi:hypothetical protein